MTNFKTTIKVNSEIHETLQDILPSGKQKLEILFIAKTPALKSVQAGHYFQGRQGQMFWNRFKEYGLLKVRPNTYEDENLLENNYGITDIVKVPRNYGNEPSEEEYRMGLNRILQTIKTHNPKVIVFVYKKSSITLFPLALENFLTTEYGFNPTSESLFKSKVFVFPMPGTPCKRQQAIHAMEELVKVLNK